MEWNPVDQFKQRESARAEKLQSERKLFEDQRDTRVIEIFHASLQQFLNHQAENNYDAASLKNVNGSEVLAYDFYDYWYDWEIGEMHYRKPPISLIIDQTGESSFVFRNVTKTFDGYSEFRDPLQSINRYDVGYSKVLLPANLEECREQQLFVPESNRVIEFSPSAMMSWVARFVSHMETDEQKKIKVQRTNGSNLKISQDDNREGELYSMLLERYFYEGFTFEEYQEYQRKNGIL